MNERINLQDLSALLADKMAITKKDAETFIREYVEVLNEELINNGSVKIKDLGAFKLSQVEDRESVNVTTGERVLIPAHYKVAFTPDKKLAETVNEPFAFFETTEIESGEPLPDEPEALSDEDTQEEPELSAGEEEEENPREHPDGLDDSPEQSVFNDDEEIPEETPADGQEQRNYCFNCHDYEMHRVYRKKYFTIQRKLNMLRAIIVILSVLLAAAVGYIVFEELSKIPDEKVQPAATPEAVPGDSVTLAADSLVPAKDSVKVEAIQKTDSIIAAGESKQITITEGQRLASIAEKEYGNKVFWIYIYLENKAIIRNPDVVPVGTAISIPPAAKYGINPDDPASVQKAKDAALKNP